MTSVTASVEIEAPVAAVWHALTDLDAYETWNHCFTHVDGPRRPLRGGDRLDAVARLTSGQHAGTLVSAIVLEVRRHRSMTWLLVPRDASAGGRGTPSLAAPLPGAPDAAVLYRVDVEAGGCGRALVVQRLQLADRPGLGDPGGGQAGHLLDALNTALRERVEHGPVSPAARPIAGVIRVLSRSGWRRPSRFLAAAPLTQLLGRGARSSWGEAAA